MNKDIIYIDTEDDITSIIGKIKASTEKIVALVPPKRTGVLQSAVNLRLLARTAKNSNKHLVLITTNKALIALSAPAKIPVAKNLQSKPEIAEMAALDVDDGEDIIEGSQLPVGELVKTVDHSLDSEVADDISSINIDGEGAKPIDLNPTNTSDNPVKKSSIIKVPDFIKFRKKLFLIAGGSILFIIFLIWAIWIAPSATVVIAAKTDPAPVSATIKLGGTDSTDINKNIIQSITKQIKKDVNVDFTATGQKDLGAKASGTIEVDNCDSNQSIPIPANTVFTSGSGVKFVNPTATSVPGLSGSASLCRATRVGAGVRDIPVVALQAGPSYNIDETDYDIEGVGGDVYATGSDMTGGTTRITTVVSADDIQKATQALNDLSTKDIKQQLVKQFTAGEKVIDQSFTVEPGNIVSSPAVDTEASGGKAKLTSNTTYSLTAIAKSELQSYLRDSLNKQIDDAKDQRIYDDGFGKVSFANYQKNDQGATVNISAIGQIGPNIDKDAIKQQVKGKRFGDVQALLEGVKGVSNVDVKFSFFWVNTVPNDTNKIDIQFTVSNA